MYIHIYYIYTIYVPRPLCAFSPLFVLLSPPLSFCAFSVFPPLFFSCLQVSLLYCVVTFLVLNI